jgi:hypothetical protein
MPRVRRVPAMRACDLTNSSAGATTVLYPSNINSYNIRIIIVTLIMVAITIVTTMTVRIMCSVCVCVRLCVKAFCEKRKKKGLL